MVEAVPMVMQLLVGFANSVAICSLVDRALQRAGVETAYRGSHLFRHSLATQMLKQGASLPEIGDLLRHRRPDTTHTIRSYRDTFRLLLQFAAKRLHKLPSALALADWTPG